MNEQSPSASLERFFSASLAETDPELAAAIRGELHRQQDGIELIASENIVSAAVLEAQGSVLTNKYAEGYPGKRYYGGCAQVDIAETLAIERAKKLFDCGFANVQPNSGSQANQAVLLALIPTGSTVLGMSLAAGGHLTHGAAPNLSGKWFNAVQYGVRREDGLLDYEELELLARAEQPKLIIAGGSAYPRVIDFARIRRVADEVGAYFMVDMAHFAGLVAAGVFPTPLPHAHVVTTTTHKTLRGPRGGMVLTNDAEIAQEDQLRRVPGPAGRAADACHRGQGGRLRRSAAAGVPRLPARRRGQRARAGRDAGRAGAGDRDRRHGQPPDAGRSPPQARHRQGGGGDAGARPHHREQERDPVRPGEARDHLRHPPRHPGRDHARLRQAEFREVGLMIAEVLDGLAHSNDGNNTAAEQAVGARVQALCARFPIYGQR